LSKIKKKLPTKTERRKKSFVLENYLLIDSLTVSYSPSPLPVDTNLASEQANKTPFFNNKKANIAR
jgi:hypothetical protein